MSRLRQFLTDRRVLGVLGLSALAAFLLLEPATLRTAALWLLIGSVALALVWGCALLVRLLVRWLLRRRASARMASGLLEAQDATPAHRVAQAGDIALLRKGLLDAIGTIKTSKLGLLRGRAALYELPWYMVIGSPASGKSSLIAHSGLQFPITASAGGQGTGGTRHCQWSFSTDGILLDTAGRYAQPTTQPTTEHAQWLGFLDLLRRHRKRVPINGIIIAVSVAELVAGDAAASLELAKSLRTRTQELTERLGVHAPVYVIFTKVDLIAGFGDFFHESERCERERAWGATMRYNRRSVPADVVAFFDSHFDELHDGLKEISLVNMAAARSTALRPGVFTFPLQFAAIKHPLRAFLATLFEENTYQFRPVFRGFYFTSALQEGQARDLSSQRVARRFDLDLEEGAATEHQNGPSESYFVRELFRQVIFPDKALVARYTAPGSARLAYAGLFCAVILLGSALGGWTWSYLGNRQLIASVQRDFDEVAALQGHGVDLQSRFAALDILHRRLLQLEQYRSERPLALSLGLYQGAALERKLRDEYLAGAARLMLQPVAASIEARLAELNATAARAGQPLAPAAYEDSYNALKTYLMLGDKSLAEAGHLNEQLTRHWRAWLEQRRGAMPRDAMMRSAARLVDYYVAHSDDPAWPQLTPKLALLDSARDTLRRLQTGTPARERVYGEIKSRAGARFAALTVARIVGDADAALISGSHAVPGAFTRDAWEQFVLPAIRDVSHKELQSTDWVLQSHNRDDLTLQGSPEQIQAALTGLYKAEYVREWCAFIAGIQVADLHGFEAGVRAMNRLGDQQTSPIARLFETIARETSWDNPTAALRSASGPAREKVERSMLAWLRESVLRQAPSVTRPVADAVMGDGVKPEGGHPIPTPADANGVAQAGPVGREFSAISGLVGKRSGNASLLSGYLDSLARLRTRLNQLKNQGDPGPGAKQFMQQTLEGGGSELADALKYVDEQVLTGLQEGQKQALRALLVRPLMQTFALIVAPTEAEINKTWQVQVLAPFRRSLADKYPFSGSSKVEASAGEIAQVFGPEGQIAKFVGNVMGALVVRRGDTLEPRTWADMGIALAPQTLAAFPGWIAPLTNGVPGMPSGPSGQGGTGAQTVFQLQPAPAPGTLEYTIEIDGQVLRYRNTPPAWTNMVHPGPAGAAGARIVATTFDGRTVEVFNAPGAFGLRRLLAAATRTRKGVGLNELAWSRNQVTVTVDLKIVSSADIDGDGRATGAAAGFLGLSLPATIVGAAPAPAPAMQQSGGMR